ncbi:MAG: DNA mismatch repair endonuclease MutL [Bacteroidales bacterium]|nr:DNA mismatch repair endonuclease MutL [Bacteroidales bacterium]
MSDIINLLPDSVANQIAAGEVVDRPASAVKELLENAVDAGASQIRLVVKDAGRTLMQVVDNGSGMSDTDARLCFERHATSKIHRADDLFAIQTMGFRGEALASIAAVAQVELRTRLHDASLGSLVLIEGAEVKQQEPCSCPAGTSIAVKNLFYNIPARRNFLKKDSIELAHIDEIFRRVALANPSVAFSFHSNGKLMYDLTAGNMAQRIIGLFGAAYRERLYPIEEHSDVVDIKGYVCKPELARRTRNEQFLLVNHRFVRHPALSTAVERGYADLIPERSYPSFFVAIDVDPRRIDVNIHPSKTEIRFVDEHAIFSILRSATKRALGQYSLSSEIEFNPSPDVDFSPRPRGYVPTPPSVTVDPTFNPFRSASHATGGDTRRAERPSRSEQWEHFFEPDRETTETVLSNEGVQASLPLVESPVPLQPPSSEVMTHQGRFIVTSVKSGLMLIDIQRAQERVMYERLLRLSEARDTHAASQQLLFPVNCSFGPADSELLAELLPDLQHIGFDMEPLGQNTFVVTATPPDIDDSNLQQMLDNTIAHYKAGSIQKFADRHQLLCLALSRQMAHKVGVDMKTEEMQGLVAALFCCQVPHLSPSGKKTLYVLDENELNEKFR